MKNPSKRVFKLLGLVFMLCFTIILTTRTSLAKTSLQPKKITLAVCETEKLRVKGTPKGAKIIYTSSKKSVVTVTSKGKITAVKAGKAVVKVSYTKSGKTTVIGKTTVTVKKATVSKKNKKIFSDHVIQFYGNTGFYEKNPADINNYVGQLWPYADLSRVSDVISYRNPKAKYVFSSGKTSRLKITKKGIVNYTNGYGKVNITVSESYKGKTRKIFSFPVNIHKPEWTGKENQDVSIGQVLDVYNNLAHVRHFFAVITDDPNKEVDVNEAASGDPVVSDDYIDFMVNSEGKWIGKIRFKKASTQYLRLYAYNYRKSKYDSTPFSTIVFNIKDITSLQGIKLLDEIADIYDPMTMEEMDFSKLSSVTEVDCGQNEAYEDYADVVDKKILICQDVYNYNGDITITSSDPGVVSASSIMTDFYEGEYQANSGYRGYFFLRPHKTGTATITVSGGGTSTSLVVNSVVPEISYEGTCTVEFRTGDIVIPSEFDESKLSYRFSDDNELNLDVTSNPEGWQNGGWDGDDERDPKRWYLRSEMRVENREDTKSGETTFEVLYDGEVIGSYELKVTGGYDPSRPPGVVKTQGINVDSYSYKVEKDEEGDYFMNIHMDFAPESGVVYAERWATFSFKPSQDDISEALEDVDSEESDNAAPFDFRVWLDDDDIEENVTKYVLIVTYDANHKFLGYALVKGEAALTSFP